MSAAARLAGLGLVGLGLVAALVGGGAAPAAASCAEDSGPAGSEVVFTGTAVEERRGFTRFQVDEVWAGPDLATEVWVESGQRQPPWPLYVLSAVSASTDAELLAGGEYVVGATADTFSTGLCRTVELSGAEDLRPEDVREPVSGGHEGADPPAGPVVTGLGFAAVVAAVVLGLVWLVRLPRRRRHPHGTA